MMIIWRIHLEEMREQVTTSSLKDIMTITSLTELLYTRIQTRKSRLSEGKKRGDSDV